MREGWGKAHRSTLLALAALCLFTWAAFAGGLDGGFLWDDGALIVGNVYIQTFDHLHEVLTSSFWNLSGALQDISDVYKQVYRPVVTFAYLIQYQLFDGNPYGFHVVSLVLHTLCVMLVWVLLRRRLPDSQGSVIAATVGALLFAIHPSRVESVSWISGSTELWMGLFVLSGMWLWEERKRGTLYAFAASICFCLAFLAKETAIVIPILLLIDNFERESSVSWKSWSIVTAVLALCFLFRVSVVPLSPSANASTLLETARRFTASIGYYTEMAVWPWVPSAQRAFRYETCSGELSFPSHALAVGVVVIAVGFIGGLLSLRRTARRGWLADCAWFLIPLLPVANLVDLHAQTLVAERFLYLPMFGVASLIARAISWGLGRRMAVGAAIATVFLIGCVGSLVVSALHTQHFQHSRALWEYEHELDPNNPEALKHLAMFHYFDRDFDEALALLKTGYAGAVERCDHSLALRFILRTSSQILGTTPDTDQETLLAVRNMYDEIYEGRSLDLRTRSIRMSFDLPPEGVEEVKADVEFFALPRAISWMRTLDLEGAQHQLEKILSVNDRNAKAWTLLVAVYARRGRWDDAETASRSAQERLPHGSGIERTIASTRQARELALQTVPTDRDRAIRDAQVQVLLGSPEAARRILMPALEASPTDVGLVVAYAKSMVADRQFDAAEAVVVRAQALDPGRDGMWLQIRQGIVEARPPQP